MFFKQDGLKILITLLVGIFIGFILSLLIYLLLILLSFKKENKKKNIVEDKKIQDIINISKLALKDLNLKGVHEIKETLNISRLLIENIASEFYSHSKYPVYELTLDESILLINYINKRIDDLLNKRSLAYFRRLKISQIITLSNINKKINDNKVVIYTKKYKVLNFFKKASQFINIINPVYWVKKLLTNNLTNIIIDKICYSIINIVGEEAYKVYSKQLFNNNNLDEQMEIDNILKEYSEE